MTIPPPFLPRPETDESLDSWLARIAHELGITRSALLTHWGTSPQTAGAILRNDDPGLIPELHRQTELSIATLNHMTLERWRTLGLKPDKHKRGHAGGSWPRGSGSRHCPECLLERDGAFRLHWYLHWSFACTTHATTLAATTDETHAGNHSFGLSQGEPGTRLAPDHQILKAQAFIDQMLDHPDQPVQTFMGPRPSREVLADLGGLVRLALVSDEARHVSRLIERLERSDPGYWLQLTPHLPRRLDLSTSVALKTSVRSGLAVGLAVALATTVLRQSSTDAAAAQLWWCSRDRLTSTQLARGLSWPVLMLLNHGRKRRSHLVLYRFDRHSFDELNQRIPPIDPAKIPSSAWPTVTLTGAATDPAISSTAISVALATLATGTGIRTALGRLGLDHLQRRVTHEWDAAFSATPDGDGNFNTIATLHKALRTHHVPIDYDRRRHTFPGPEPLGPRVARRIERQTGVRLTPRTQALIAWYIWELLTGSDLLMSEHGIDMPGTWRSAYRRQRNTWHQHQPTPLLEAAETRLYRLRIDEPVAWAPQPSLNAWHLPLHGTPRQLNGWSNTNRRMQGQPRPPATTATGMTFESAVAFASRADTKAAYQLALKLARFVAVADQRGYTNAAAHTSLSQSTLSMAVQDLEGALGAKLIERNSRRVSMTDEGRRLRQVIAQEAPGLSPAKKCKVPKAVDAD